MKQLKIFLLILTLTLTISAMTSCDVEGLKDKIMGAIPGLGSDCEHSWTEATCTLPSRCEKCGATEGSALGHTEKTVPGYEPTCTVNGKKDDVICATCGEVLVHGDPILATGKHTPGAEATCTTDQICTVCQEVVVEKHHTPGPEATCTTDQICTVCQEVVVEKHHTPGPEATCTTDQICTECEEVLVEGKHTPGDEATCTTDQICTVCDEVLVEGGHIEKTVPGHEPSCFTEGLTEGKECERCGETLLAQESISAIGHHTPGDEATCYKDQICTVCEVVLVEGDHTPGPEATCTTDQSCTVCKLILVKRHHVEVVVPGYPATCLQTGRKDGKKCSVCGVITVAQQYISLAPHTKAEIPAVAPTCTDKGHTAGVICSVCHRVLTKPTDISATGHSFSGREDCATCGQEYYSEGMTFTIGSDKDGRQFYILTSIGTVSDADIVIPSTYKGLPVEIIDGDFTRYSVYKANFKTVTIPKTIREIRRSSSGRGAFEGCTNLKKVYIESLEDWFNVWVYSGSSPMRYGAELYEGGELVTEVTVPSSITELEFDCFDGCTSITKINFHDSLYTVAGFANMPNITEVTLPNSVRIIKGSSFYKCASLSVINVPDTTYHIFATFEGTAYYNNPDNWDQGKVLYVGKHLICAKSDIEGEYTLRADTKSIAPNGFSGCTKLTALNLNSGLLTIGYSAFYNTYGLKGITIPYSVRYIGYDAFRGMNRGNTSDLELVFEYRGAWFQHGNLYHGLESPGYIYGSRNSAYVVYYVNNERVTGSAPYGSPTINSHTYSYSICR